MNYVVLEGSRLEFESYLVVSNNYFSRETINYSNNLNIKLIDRDKMAKYIIDFGIRPD